MSWLKRLLNVFAPKAENTPTPVMSTSSKAPNAAEYQQLYNTLKIDKGREEEVLRLISAIRDGRMIYEKITERTGVPWEVIGVIHNMECSLSFKKHLHNGDPLTARTRQIPKGRPITGAPPFNFIESAVDALQYDAFHKNSDWSIPGTFYMLEKYNGMGYRKRREDNPYLWAASNHSDERGKFVADGKFDPNAISKQVGVGLLFKGLREGWGA